MAIETVIDFGRQDDSRKKWIYETWYKKKLTKDGRRAFEARRGDPVEFAWTYAHPKKWPGQNKFMEWAGMLNLEGERTRPFMEGLTETQEARFREALVDYAPMMKHIAALGDSRFTLVALEGKLRDALKGGSGWSIGATFPAELQAYGRAANHRATEMKLEAQQQADALERSNRKTMRAFGNTAEDPWRD